MKKLLTIVAGVALIASFASCKKCIECTIKEDDQSFTVEECYDSRSEMKDEKEKVDKECEAYEAADPDVECDCQAS